MAFKSCLFLMGLSLILAQGFTRSWAITESGEVYLWGQNNSNKIRNGGMFIDGLESGFGQRCERRYFFHKLECGVKAPTSMP